MRSFENRRVVVTSSGRGIGKAIPHRFARGGAKVLLVACSRKELDESRAELLVLTSEVQAVALDPTFPDSCRQLVTKASEFWGGLDILITNGRAAAQGGFLELDDDAWLAGFGLKMFANLRVIRHVWPLLKESSGHLVMIGGGTARTPDHRLSLVSAWRYCRAFKINRRTEWRSREPGSTGDGKDFSPAEALRKMGRAGGPEHGRVAQCRGFA